MRPSKGHLRHDFTGENQRRLPDVSCFTAHLKLKGWSTYYLGPNNLSRGRTGRRTATSSPSIVCLSFPDKHGINSSLDFLSRFECKVCHRRFRAR